MPSFDNFVLYAFMVLFVIVLVIGTWGKLFKGPIQADDFEKKPVHGVIVTLRHAHHGNCVLTVLNPETKTTEEYTLLISGFVKRHNIQTHDSIAKHANSQFASVYRKNGAGSYYKIVDINLWNTLE
jgi:hypothetical protein